MADKYRPETKAQKKKRLLEKAEKIAKGGEPVATKGPSSVKYGLKHITGLIEKKKAALVLIAHDVDPIELVLWLPALCRKQGVPYAIIKGKARLGQIVGKKTATALAFVGADVKSEDKAEFGKVVEAVKERFNDRFDEIRKSWGGQKLGIKSRTHILQKEKIKRKEAAKIA